MENTKNVIVVVGAGVIGQAIARRIGAGKHILLADLHKENADAAAKSFIEAGFEVSTAIVDISSRESVHSLVETANKIGAIVGVIHAAGVSPSQASPVLTLVITRHCKPQGKTLLMRYATNKTLKKYALLLHSRKF